ncbi:AGAP003730-PA-like protein [Anopheles sinensis]|uniref:AGAP003730-PA-like protein n=1 Tax=Anopheles sinensis TaxID=74873 RepID=A0A084VZW9_ANOSI|nr:AGAP003730-PA-like protein [Anopheles sinensis]
MAIAKMTRSFALFFRLTVVLLLLGCASSGAEAYRLGVGRADCTGPPVEIGFVSIWCGVGH